MFEKPNWIFVVEQQWQCLSIRQICRATVRPLTIRIGRKNVSKIVVAIWNPVFLLFTKIYV